MDTLRNKLETMTPNQLRQFAHANDIPTKGLPRTRLIEHILTVLEEVNAFERATCESSEGQCFS